SPGHGSVYRAAASEGDPRRVLDKRRSRSTTGRFRVYPGKGGCKITARLGTRPDRDVKIYAFLGDHCAIRQETRWGGSQQEMGESQNSQGPSKFYGQTLASRIKFGWALTVQRFTHFL